METLSNHSELDIGKTIEVTIINLLQARKPSASICPSEAARLVFGKDWRNWMPEIREIAGKMSKQNKVEICQKGVVTDIDTVKGPIRIRLPLGSNS